MKSLQMSLINYIYFNFNKAELFTVSILKERYDANLVVPNSW